MKRLGSDSESVPNVLLVDHIVWRTSGTVADIAVAELQGMPHQW